MTAPDSHATSDATMLSELGELRDALLQALGGLSEARLFAATEREGWTLRHELSGMAAADHELLHVLEAVAAARPPVGDARSSNLRRIRGEAMHRTQEQRLSGIRERLEANAEAVSQAIAGAAPDHAAPLALGEASPTLAEYLHAYREQARGVLRTVAAVSPSR